MPLSARIAILAPGLIGFAACAAPADFVEVPPRRVSVEYGARSYSGTGWDDFGDDEQTAIGLTIAAEAHNTFIGGDIGFFWSEGRGDLQTRDVSLDSYELHLGLMKAIKLADDRFRIEVGGGGVGTLLSGHDSNAAAGDRYDRDVYVGVYGRLGINFRIGAGAWLGLGGRVVRGGQGDLFEGELDGDYEQATIALSIGL